MKDNRWKAITEYYMKNPEFRFEYDNDPQFREFIELLADATEEQIREVKRLLKQGNKEGC